MDGKEKTDFEIITSSRLWVATPGVYSSSRWLRFQNDETADFCYGFGQTIYAVISCRFKVLPEKNLSLTYLISPPIGNTFKGFTPIQGKQIKEIQYKLKEETSIFSHQITGKRFQYHWLLILNKSPYPDELKFPYDTPLEFFGHRENIDFFDCKRPKH